MSSDSYADILAFFTELEAPNPESWARSEFEEGIPQRARFLFLKQAWALIHQDRSIDWIARSIGSSERRPRDPHAGEGHALKRLLADGADPADLTELVRNAQAELLFSFCYLLDDPGMVPPIARDYSWGLFLVDEEGEPLVPTVLVSGLYESVLATDPTGREMRPHTD
jgi:hypothetical protein